MCRCYVTAAAASVEREFGLNIPDWQFPANFNTLPSALVPAIRAEQGGIAGVLQRWGFGKNRIFNVRIETLATNPISRAPWNHGRRCIIPALGFYEWHVDPDGTKHPYYIHADDQDVFGFAGLWERSRVDANAVTESCVMVTVPANALMAEIHNTKTRMPAILTREQHDRWLFADPPAAGAALAAYPQERMIAYPVSTRVDSPCNNDETLLEPLETDVD
jgi:putative SOS response-associated peptidase YedK